MTTYNQEETYSDIYSREYDAVLIECPEYSDSSSMHYDLSHCETLATERANRIIERGEHQEGGED